MSKPLFRVAPLNSILLALGFGAFAAAPLANAELLWPTTNDYFLANATPVLTVASMPSSENEKKAPSPQEDDAAGVATDIDDSDSDPADAIAGTSSPDDHVAPLPSHTLAAEHFRARGIARDLPSPPLHRCRLLEKHSRERAPPTMK